MDGRTLVGLNIRKLRVERGISQERLAFDSGVDRSYLGGLERGEHNPTVDVLDRLAVTLAVSLKELFADIDDDDLGNPGLPRGRRRKP